jgi:hypothetical protein
VVRWRFRSIDPATGQPTTDPLAGFLPPNLIPPQGQGNVMFSVQPKLPLAAGTQIQNQASIVFDTNAPILTPVWTNTVDDSKPSSALAALSPTQSAAAFPVAWSGFDTGSGVASYNIYVSDNGAAFHAWLASTTATQSPFTGENGHTYRFFSIARDLAGNSEDPKTTAEATTTVALPVCAANLSGQIGVTRGGYRLNLSTQRYVQAVTLKNNGTTPVQGPISLVLDGLSANAALFNKSGVTACGAPLGSPYLNFNSGADGILNPGESAAAILEFTNPANQGITYNTRVLAGPAAR